MKYFTKEWHNKMQCTGMHILLRIDERCGKYSDELFTEIYNKERNQYLKIMSFCEDFNEFSNLMVSVDKNFSSLDLAEQQKRFDAFREEELGGLSLNDKFAEKLELAIQGLKEKLDKDFLTEVSDIRVLALGYASEDIYKKLEDLSNENEKFVNSKVKEYADYLRENMNEGLAILDEDLHDSFITKIEKKDNDLCMSLDSIGSSNKMIIFKDYEIILDEGIDDGYWLYNEVYRTNSGLEIHILASTDKLKEMIIRCSEAIVK